MTVAQPSTDTTAIRDALKAAGEEAALAGDQPACLQILEAEQALDRLDAVAQAARDYVGDEPLKLWARYEAGEDKIGVLSSRKWRRLVKALYDLER